MRYQFRDTYQVVYEIEAANEEQARKRADNTDVFDDCEFVDCELLAVVESPEPEGVESPPVLAVDLAGWVDVGLLTRQRVAVLAAIGLVGEVEEPVGDALSELLEGVMCLLDGISDRFVDAGIVSRAETFDRWAAACRELGLGTPDEWEFDVGEEMDAR